MTIEAAEPHITVILRSALLPASRRKGRMHLIHPPRLAEDGSHLRKTVFSAVKDEEFSFSLHAFPALRA
jgi:hypothetical protein